MKKSVQARCLRQPHVLAQRSGRCTTLWLRGLDGLSRRHGWGGLRGLKEGGSVSSSESPSESLSNTDDDPRGMHQLTFFFFALFMPMPL